MSDIKQRLRAYWYCSQRLDKLYDKYHAIRARAEKMTPAYSLAPGGGSGDMADTVAMLADMEKQYQQERHELMATMHEVEAIISSLDDYRMRIIMEDRYIHFEKWEQIAVDRHYSYRYVIELHGMALKILGEK
jgi:hypothetical protein